MQVGIPSCRDWGVGGVARHPCTHPTAWGGLGQGGDPLCAPHSGLLGIPSRAREGMGGFPGDGGPQHTPGTHLLPRGR